MNQPTMTDPFDSTHYLIKHNIPYIEFSSNSILLPFYLLKTFFFSNLLDFLPFLIPFFLFLYSLKITIKEI